MMIFREETEYRTIDSAGVILFMFFSVSYGAWVGLSSLSAQPKTGVFGWEQMATRIVLLCKVVWKSRDDIGQ